MVDSNNQNEVLIHETKGWKIQNGIVTYPENIDPKKAYRFLLEAVYDGHLPVTRVIGYTLVTAKINKSSSGKGMFSRSPSGLDDKMSIVSNVSKLLIIEDNIKKPSSKATIGEVNIDNVVLQYSMKPLTVLSTGHYIMSNTEETSLEFVVNCCTGFRDAQYNYNQIMKVSNTEARSRYTPMPSYHNIIDFVSIRPLDDSGVLKLHYSHGMKDEYFRIIFDRLFKGVYADDWAKNSEVLHA